MSPVIENIICNIVSSIIFDISKVIFGRIESKKMNFEKDYIKKYVTNILDNKYDSLCDSGVLNEFFNNPLIIDTIDNYIIYIINGKIENSVLEKIIKKNRQTLEENDIIIFLVNRLIEVYKQNDVLHIPSVFLLQRFFSDLFKICSNYIYDQMSMEEIAMIYFVNNKMNLLGNNVFSKLDEIVNILNKNIQSDMICQNEQLLKNKNIYTKILKENHKMAHIYLLDKFEMNKFYVPPFLTKGKEKMRGLNSRYINNHEVYINRFKANFNINKEEIFDDWKYIFDCSNIIYITGGAGYGKSLFMKKIIEEYDKLNLIGSEDYMIIYGELKMFYANNHNIPMSVIDFLQNSMKKETLLEDEIVSKDLINYYLKRGRCIILLDALDEVEKGKRNDLHKTVVNYFKSQNPNNKVCITSRSRGFLPEKDIEVFEIEALDAIQIETYVDNIIRLGKFDIEDREAFLKQTKILVKKGFLSSFLVLSLLINIYKAERELPENKLELYQKCFEYIANRREKEKSQEKYDWKLISILMKDNTFMELSNMCLPNNSDVQKGEIKEKLTQIYKGKYVSENETELAIDQFLQFCSDRTELFVPASGEDCFKFFHRSFFEYFYSQYIFTRMQNTEDIYNALSVFDIDSEVFELTLAMFKQKNESKYQEIVDFILNKVYNKSLSKEDRLNAINILILGLQVIDDELFKKRFVDFLLSESEFCFKNKNKIHNQTIIVKIIESKREYYEKICEEYKFKAIFESILFFLKVYPDAERFMRKDGKKKSDNLDEEINILGVRFRHFHNYNFYTQVFFEHMPIKVIIEYIKSIDDLAKDNGVSQKQINKIKSKCNKYLQLDVKKRKIIEEILLEND